MKRSKRLTKRQRKENTAAFRMEADILTSVQRREQAAMLSSMRSAAHATRMAAKIRNFSRYYGSSAFDMKTTAWPL